MAQRDSNTLRRHNHRAEQAKRAEKEKQRKVKEEQERLARQSAAEAAERAHHAAGRLGVSEVVKRHSHMPASLYNY